MSACSSLQKSQFSARESACFKAVVADDREAIKKILPDCKKSRAENGVTPLMLAAAKGHVKIIEELIQAGEDVNEADAQGDMALNYAVVRRQVAAVHLLMLHQASVKPKRPDGITVLMQAVQHGSQQMVQILVQDAEGVNIQAEDGWTALYFAIRRQDEDILKLLLRHGSCPNVIDKYQQSPLDFAQEVGWKKGIDLLKKATTCKS
ncbi:MAG: ankyrin repeat domain-containing protein [Bdellovibrio sp.]